MIPRRNIVVSVVYGLCPNVWWHVTRSFNIGCICLVLVFEIVSMAIDIMIRFHISKSWKAAEEFFFYTSSILMIFFACGNVFLQFKQYKKLEYTKHGGRRWPWLYEVDPPHRIFGSAVTIGVMFAAVCQFVVILVRFYKDFDSWIPTMVMYFTAGAVVFEIVQELVFEERTCHLF